ncbi:MAG: DUF3576 domain-containing protein [Alphaproteobacteria bacterium]
MITRSICTALAATGLLALLAACADTQAPGEMPNLEEQQKQGQGKLFGDIEFGSGGRETEPGGGGGGIGVNSFLWRASLDTLSFLPLASADPFGGVIITDWYAPPESPDERFKVTVYLLGTQLRSDGIRVAVFRQTRDNRGNWTDATLTDETENKLADAILSRARELRIASNPG